MHESNRKGAKEKHKTTAVKTASTTVHPPMVPSPAPTTSASEKPFDPSRIIPQNIQTSKHHKESSTTFTPSIQPSTFEYQHPSAYSA